MSKKERKASDPDGYSLFANEEKVLADAALMIESLEEAGRGVRDLAEAYAKGFKEQARLVRLSDRMQMELHSANQRLAEQAEELKHLNMALTVEIEQRKSLEEELRRLAIMDDLTGAFSRRYFFEVWDRECKKTKRSDAPLCVLVMDLDHFKLINDTHGHMAGDRALMVFVRLCLETVREIDPVGRLGGEEFAILLPDTTPESAAAVAERIRSRVEDTDITYNQKTFRLTVSIGGTVFTLEDGGPERMFSRADKALYQAKGLGRNRVVMRQP